MHGQPPFVPSYPIQCARVHRQQIMLHDGVTAVPLTAEGLNHSIKLYILLPSLTQLQIMCAAQIMIG